MQAPKKLSTLRVLFFTYQLCLHFFTSPHGFGAQTYVRLTDNSFQPIEMLCKRVSKEKNIYVVACDLDHKLLARSLLVASGSSESNCYIQLAFDNRLDPDIICTPYQEFYVPKRGGWIAAYQLRLGDQLLSYSGVLKSITRSGCVAHAMPVYILKVKNTHTFFVGRHSVLTHNMNLVTLHLSSCSAVLPITMAGGGACFGPLGAMGMAIATVGVSTIINYCLKDRQHTYTNPFFDTSLYRQPSFDTVNNQNENQVTKSRVDETKAVEKDNLPQKHPNGIYQDAPYHHQNSTGKKSPAPKNGQKALDNSAQIKETSKARVGVSEGEIVILRNTRDNIYHGHVVTWKKLESTSGSDIIINALKKNNLVDKKGKII